jgi:hypothetical protein
MNDVDIAAYELRALRHQLPFSGTFVFQLLMSDDPTELKRHDDWMRERIKYLTWWLQPIEVP